MYKATGDPAFLIPDPPSFSENESFYGEAYFRLLPVMKSDPLTFVHVKQYLDFFGPVDYPITFYETLQAIDEECKSTS